MNALDINKLKQELKLIVDTNLRDYDKVASLLNVENIKSLFHNRNKISVCYFTSFIFLTYLNYIDYKLL